MGKQNISKKKVTKVHRRCGAKLSVLEKARFVKHIRGILNECVGK